MLKIAVFGTGHLGKFHLNNWQEIDQVTLVGFFDPDDNNARAVEEKYKIPALMTRKNSWMPAMRWTSWHQPFTISTCVNWPSAKANTFLWKNRWPIPWKKPATWLNWPRNRNVKFQVGHVERFNPAFLALKEYALNPMFIEVHRLAQFNPRGTDVSVILDLMIHDIDIILSLVKAM